MKATVILEGTYSPKDYFEEPRPISGPQLTVNLNDGQLTATLECEADNPKDDFHRIHNQIRKSIDRIFQFRQITKHTPFRFDTRSVRVTLSDGTTYGRTYSEPTPAIFTTTPYDTSPEAVKKAQKDEKLITRAIKYGRDDETLDALITFLQRSITDPDQEISHLYDIRDALRKRFGTIGEARNKLSISQQQWKLLDDLANERGLEEGRHRGRHHTSLRKAKEEELDGARRIGRLMIYKYIHYLKLQA